MKYYINGKEIAQEIESNKIGIARNRIKSLRNAPSGMATDDISMSVPKAVAGTVAVAAGSDQVTGTNTDFTKLSVGDEIKIGDEIRTITAIASGTSLTVDAPIADEVTAGSPASEIISNPTTAQVVNATYASANGFGEGNAVGWHTQSNPAGISFINTSFNIAGEDVITYAGNAQAKLIIKDASTGNIIREIVNPFAGASVEDGNIGSKDISIDLPFDADFEFTATLVVDGSEKFTTQHTLAGMGGLTEEIKPSIEQFYTGGPTHSPQLNVVGAKGMTALKWQMFEAGHGTDPSKELNSGFLEVTPGTEDYTVSAIDLLDGTAKPYLGYGNGGFGMVEFVLTPVTEAGVGGDPIVFFSRQSSIGTAGTTTFDTDSNMNNVAPDIVQTTTSGGATAAAGSRPENSSNILTINPSSATVQLGWNLTGLEHYLNDPNVALQLRNAAGAVLHEVQGSASVPIPTISSDEVTLNYQDYQKTDNNNGYYSQVDVKPYLVDTSGGVPQDYPTITTSDATPYFFVQPALDVNNASAVSEQPGEPAKIQVTGIKSSSVDRIFLEIRKDDANGDLVYSSGQPVGGNANGTYTVGDNDGGTLGPGSDNPGTTGRQPDLPDGTYHLTVIGQTEQPNNPGQWVDTATHTITHEVSSVNPAITGSFGFGQTPYINLAAAPQELRAHDSWGSPITDHQVVKNAAASFDSVNSEGYSINTISFKAKAVDTTSVTIYTKRHSDGYPINDADWVEADVVDSSMMDSTPGDTFGDFTTTHLLEFNQGTAGAFKIQVRDTSSGEVLYESPTKSPPSSASGVNGAAHTLNYDHASDEWVITINTPAGASGGFTYILWNETTGVTTFGASHASPPNPSTATINMDADVYSPFAYKLRIAFLDENSRVYRVLSETGNWFDQVPESINWGVAHSPASDGTIQVEAEEGEWVEVATNTIWGNVNAAGTWKGTNMEVSDSDNPGGNFAASHELMFNTTRRARIQAPVGVGNTVTGYVEAGSAAEGWTQSANVTITTIPAIDTSDDNTFKFKVNTYFTSAGGTDNQTFKLPLYDGDYDFWIDWGDGSPLEHHVHAHDNAANEHNIGDTMVDISHTYSNSYTEYIKIHGEIGKSWRFANEGDVRKIVEIATWGNFSLGAFAFNGCSELTTIHGDKRPKFFDQSSNLAGGGDTASLNAAFDSCQKLTSLDFSGTTTPHGVNLVGTERMFKNCSALTSFNFHPDGFNTSTVESMSRMFYGCSVFNSSVGNFNVSSLSNALEMFYACAQFNQPFGNWNTGPSDTANLEDASGMFHQCADFNQPLSDWDTSSLKYAHSMLAAAHTFNKPVFSGFTPHGEGAANMFHNCYDFAQTLTNWDVSNATSFSTLFRGTAFNDPCVSSWTPQDDINLYSMFADCSSFNQPLPWTMKPKATGAGISYCFKNATSFDQDLSSWDMSGFTVGGENALDVFLNVTMSQSNYDALTGSTWGQSADLGPALAQITVVDDPQVPFIFTVKTGATGSSDTDAFTIPMHPSSTGENACVIEWGDGTQNVVVAGTAYNDDVWRHYYKGFNANHDPNDLMEIKITSTKAAGLPFFGMVFGEAPSQGPGITASQSATKLHEIKQWGCYGQAQSSSSGGFPGKFFMNCNHMTISATDIPASISTNQEDAFLGCQALTNIHRYLHAPVWAIGTATGNDATSLKMNFRNLFRNCGNMQFANFPSSLGAWADGINSPTTPGITALGAGRLGADGLESAFHSCPKFNDPSVINIDLRNLMTYTGLQSTFEGCFVFNQPLPSYNGRADSINYLTTNGVNFDSTFKYCRKFNQSVAPWKDLIHRARNMYSFMFQCYAFVGDGFSVSPDYGVGDIETEHGVLGFGHIYYASQNTPISCAGVFHSCKSLRRLRSDLDMSGVSNMSDMLKNCEMFSADIGGWTLSDGVLMDGFFANGGDGMSPGDYTRTLDGWAAQTGVSNVTITMDNCDYGRGNGVNSVSTLEGRGWSFSGHTNGGSGNSPMIINISGPNSSNQIMLGKAELVIHGAASVDWGDGNTDYFDEQSGPQFEYPIHQYADGQPRTIEIHGDLVSYQGPYPDGEQPGNIALHSSKNITSVTSFGDLPLQSLRGAFCHHETLESLPQHKPDHVTDIGNMMSMAMNNTDSFNEMSSWDMQNVEFMDGLFKYCFKFNEDISDWNVSNVRSMKDMFNNAKQFNGFLGRADTGTNDPYGYSYVKWETLNVVTMEGMFQGASAFTGAEGNAFSAVLYWDVSNVRNMKNMFKDAPLFNGNVSRAILASPIGGYGSQDVWNTNNVHTMEGMFQGATAFNNGVESLNLAILGTDDGLGWVTRSLHSTENMFRGATSYNQPMHVKHAGWLGFEWDTSDVTSFVMMFKDATSFNQDSINGWCTTDATDAAEFSQGAPAGDNGYNPTPSAHAQ